MVCLLSCAALFALGIAQLFKLRFETGDVYPAYSSLRADPLGAMAFCESLEKLPELSVRRDFGAANRMPDGKRTTYLHLAGRVYDWERLPEDAFKEISAFLRRGGRLVVTFFPQTERPYRFEKKKKGDELQKPDAPEKSAKPERVKKPKESKDAGEDESRFVSLKDRWGVEFGFVELEQTTDTDQATAAANLTAMELPPSISWHTGTIFTNLDESWRTVYARGTHPVVIERKFGAGSVVLSSDSYFLSNEALRAERHADLLAWLVGPNKRVIFDEAHFGITDAPGIAALARKYRLHGLIAGFLLLAGLFIWRNSVGLAPPYPDPKRELFVPGKDSAAGFVNLLRRNVASRDALNVCLAEWNKSFARSGNFSAVKRQRVQAALEAENALPPKARDPVKAYQTICRMLREAELGARVAKSDTRD